jgi:amino acid transporter
VPVNCQTWIFYALNPASEAVAMVDNLATWSRPWKVLVTVNSHGQQVGLTPRGIGVTALFLVLIAAVNLLGPRVFFIINNVLTLFKILVPLLIIFCLFMRIFTRRTLMALVEVRLLGQVGEQAIDIVDARFSLYSHNDARSHTSTPFDPVSRIRSMEF